MEGRGGDRNQHRFPLRGSSWGVRVAVSSPAFDLPSVAAPEVIFPSTWEDVPSDGEEHDDAVPSPVALRESNSSCLAPCGIF